jgi:hypothetical protein
MEDGYCCLVENKLAALVGKRPQTDEGMGERGHDMARHCCQGKGGCQSKCGTDHQAFRATVCHTNIDGWGAGIVVGDWGAWCKVEAIGAGVGNASVKIWKDWGGSWRGFSQ